MCAAFSVMVSFRVGNGKEVNVIFSRVSVIVFSSKEWVTEEIVMCAAVSFIIYYKFRVSQ